MRTITLLLALVFSTIIANAQVPHWDWAITAAGGQVQEIGGKSTTDNQGNIYLAGSFSGQSLSIDQEVITNANPNYSKLYLTKRNSSGELLWFKSNFTTTQSPFADSYLRAIATDAAGNIFITGSFRDHVTFDNITVSNPGIYEYGIFLFKFDSDGNALWGKRAGGSGTAYDFAGSTDMALDTYGNIYIAGKFQNPILNFGNGVSLNVSGFQDHFVVKYNSEGNAIWAKQSISFNDPYSLEGTLIAVDNDNVYISAHFSNSSIYFDGQILTNNNFSGNIFLVKYDASDGNLIFAKQFGSGGSVLMDDLKIKDEYIYMAGSFNSNFILGSTTLSSIGYRDIFVAKLDNNGSPLWAIEAGGADFESPSSLEIDLNHNIYFAGIYKSDLMIEGNIIPGSVSGETNTTVVKLNNNGEFVWYIRPEGVNAGISSLNIMTNGDILTSGFYRTDIAFGNTIFDVAGEISTKLFIAKLSQVDLGLPAFRGNTITVYPNPVKNKLNVFSKNTITNTFFTITDMAGRVIKTGDYNNSIDVSFLPAGMYFLNINGSAIKFIKE